MSSLRLCSIPRCVLILAYRAVPVRFLFSRYGMCWWVRASRYFLARPKSIMYTRLPFLPRPLKVINHKLTLFIDIQGTNWGAISKYYLRNNQYFCIYTYIKKLSGLMSRCMKFLLCMYSILEISWSASNSTVLRLNRLEQKLKRSSKLGPSNSITITLKSPSEPHHLIVGIPTPPCMIR